MDKILRTRKFFITINNYSELEYNQVKEYIETKTIYGILCKEIAPTTGTPHIHAYLYHQNAISFNTLKRLFIRANIQEANGSPEQNRIYMTKTDKDCYIYGEEPHKGKRTDLQVMRNMAIQGATIRDMVPNLASIQSLKAADIIMKYYEKPRDFKPFVLWLYGPSETGKTRYVYDNFKEVYSVMVSNNLKWFEGYDAHETLLIDDLRPNDIQFTKLLKLLDRYEFRVETKGSTRQLLAKNIIITSSFHPYMFVPYGEETKQLIRRIDNIVEYKSI